jgi:hypothetical protein
LAARSIDRTTERESPSGFDLAGTSIANVTARLEALVIYAFR